MGFLDNWKAKKAAKIQEDIAKAQTMADDAKDIMKAIESPYVEAKRNLSDYESALKFKPSKAYKYASKGYTAAVLESEAAKTYTQAVEMLASQNKMNDSKIKSMDQKYRNCIATGNTKAAKDIAYRLYSEASRNPDAAPLKVSLDDSTISDGELEVVISNRESKPIVVNSIACRSGSQELLVEDGMAETVPAGGQTSRLVRFEPDSSMDIVVSVDYESGYEHLKIKRTFSLRKKI